MNPVTCMNCAHGIGTRLTPKCGLVRFLPENEDGSCPYYEPKQKPRREGVAKNAQTTGEGQG